MTVTVPGMVCMYLVLVQGIDYAAFRVQSGLIDYSTGSTWYQVQYLGCSRTPDGPVLAQMSF
jgi:hypothetical protein